MTEDQLVVNKTAITLQTNNLDLDLLLPDVNWYGKPALLC
jgi:cohesin complex subunit SCC1